MKRSAIHLNVTCHNCQKLTHLLYNVVSLCLLPHDDTSKNIVPHQNGTVYELDGLQSAPIPVGTYATTTTDDFPWLSIARTAIQSRIEKYQSSEIKFNLMALTADKRSILQSKIKSATDIGDEAMVASLNMELVAEEDLREKWKEENERRRHNYLPFCVELLRALGKSGTLQGCTRRANEKMAKARVEKRAF